jgi:HK97 family phage prohead protease
MQPTPQRSWSVLTVKSIDDELRIVRGIASTPSTDRSGDIVEPLGAKFSLPIPLLSQHDRASPIGAVTSATVTADGIEIEAHIPKNSGLAYVETAWNQIKAGLVRGLSIGFQALSAEPIKGTNGIRFKTWAWHELSAVTIPANADASIISVKQFDLPPVRLHTRAQKVALARAAAAVKSVASLIPTHKE